MNEEVIARLKKEFEEIIKGEPFYGKVTHRTRPMFISKWKEILDREGLKRSDSWVDDLLKSLGR